MQITDAHKAKLDAHRTARNTPLETGGKEDMALQTAIKEINAGKKTNHYIWYIMPQLKSIARGYYDYNKEQNKHRENEIYGIDDIEEAIAFLKDKDFLTDYTKVIDAIVSSNYTIKDIFKEDWQKVNSSITLFSEILNSTKSFPELLKDDKNHDIKGLQDILKQNLNKIRKDKDKDKDKGFVECNDTKLKIATFKNILKSRTECQYYQPGKNLKIEQNNNKVNFATHVKVFKKDLYGSTTNKKDNRIQETNKSLLDRTQYNRSNRANINQTIPTKTDIFKPKDIPPYFNNNNKQTNYQNLNLADTTQNHQKTINNRNQKTNNNIPKPAVVNTKYNSHKKPKINANKSDVNKNQNNGDKVRIINANPKNINEQQNKTDETKVTETQKTKNFWNTGFGIFLQVLLFVLTLGIGWAICEACGLFDNKKHAQKVVDNKVSRCNSSNNTDKDKTVSNQKQPDVVSKSKETNVQKLAQRNNNNDRSRGY